MSRPTHVLVGTSDGDKLTGERWITLEDFARLFTWGTSYTEGARGLLTHKNVIRVARDTEGDAT